MCVCVGRCLVSCENVHVLKSDSPLVNPGAPPLLSYTSDVIFSGPSSWGMMEPRACTWECVVLSPGLCSAPDTQGRSLPTAEVSSFLSGHLDPRPILHVISFGSLRSPGFPPSLMSQQLTLGQRQEKAPGLGVCSGVSRQGSSTEITARHIREHPFRRWHQQGPCLTYLDGTWD